MNLFIIRHAQAGHFGDPQWPDDSQRPLTDEGRERFASMIGQLVGRGFSPEIIATSPLMRCSQTAEIIAEGVKRDPEVIELDSLMPGLDLQKLLAWTNEQGREFRNIAWVGHAPDVGRVTSELCGERGMWIRFNKGSIASIRFHGPAAPSGGELRWLVTPKVLGC